MLHIPEIEIEKTILDRNIRNVGKCHRSLINNNKRSSSLSPDGDERGLSTH